MEQENREGIGVSGGSWRLYFIMSTRPAEAAIFVLADASPRRPEVTYFAGKEA